MEAQILNFDSPTSIKTIQIWADGDTRKLLDLYSKYMPDVGPLKKFRTKKDMWAAIASEVPERTAKQCEERYKTVMRRKKLAVDNNKASGSKRMRVDFEEELNKISLIDDSVEPEIQISSSKYIKVEKGEKLKMEKLRVRSKTVQETWTWTLQRRKRKQEKDAIKKKWNC